MASNLDSAVRFSVRVLPVVLILLYGFTRTPARLRDLLPT
jgi:hypothetical protein